MLLGAFLANKRSALLEAVEVGTTGLTFTTAATIYAACGYNCKIDKNPYSKKKCARTPFARPKENSERCPLVLGRVRRLSLLLGPLDFRHRLAMTAAR